MKLTSPNVQLSAALKSACSTSRAHLFLIAFIVVVTCCFYFSGNSLPSPIGLFVKDRGSQTVSDLRQLSGQRVEKKGNVLQQHWKPDNAFNDSILQVLEKRYAERLRRAEKVCSQQEPALKNRFWSIASNEVDGKPRACSTRQCTILLDKTNLIYYCFVQKVASTAIKTYFLKITNKTTAHSAHDNVTAFHIEANDAITRISPMFYSRQKRQHFYKIIFVRHPFARLVSAYENKVLGPRDKLSFFFNNYWDKAMKKYRGVEQLDSDARPTFEEFVRYLLDTPVYKYDSHWVPYTKRCQPCLVHYDFIGKLETAEQDFHYVFQHELGLTETPAVENRGATTGDKVMFYFRQVPKSEILRLYYTYKMDFDIFGYEVNDFLK